MHYASTMYIQGPYLKLEIFVMLPNLACLTKLGSSELISADGKKAIRGVLRLLESDYESKENCFTAKSESSYIVFFGQLPMRTFLSMQCSYDLATSSSNVHCE